MNGTDLQRVMRVTGNLISHPGYLPRYLPFTGGQPLDVALPWYSFGAIDFLSRQLSQKSVVFEWGGGGSTLFWAQRVKRVICVESSEEWDDKLTQVLYDKGIQHVTVLRHSFEPSDKAGFEQSGYLKCVDDYDADLYVVDGYEEAIQLRPLCFEKAENRVKKGGMIVLDDSWRYEDVRVKNRSAKHIIFESVGPCRYGVTATDVFLY